MSSLARDIKLFEINEYLHGKYGASPAPVNEEVRAKIIGNDPVITHRPADDFDLNLMA